MAALRTNILSNYAGQLWMALMAVAFLPLYIRVLGMEAFGLVGLMLSLQAISQLFDFGIGGAVNRELSRRSHGASRINSARDLVRTFEWVIWPMTLLVGLGIWAGSGPVAGHWLHPHSMGRAEIAHAIAIMGIAVALLWPSGFYSNCLSGLEQQPTLNLITAAFATLRGAGVLAVLHWVSPTIGAFLWWYAAMGACQSLVTAAVVWRRLPRGDRRAIFVSDELRGNGRFASGLFLISVLSLGLTQIDRLSLATLRPLAELGYYTLALSVAAGLGRMVQPMFNALYPRFSRLVAADDTQTLSQLYHLGNQCVAVVIAAVSLVLIVFAKDVIFLWTGDSALSAKVAMPLAILVGATALNGLMNLPYALQLANGWTTLALRMNLALLLLAIPFCVWAVARHGIVGAAWCWLLINVGFFAVGIPLMHRRLLRGEMAAWYLHDILPPLLAATAVAVVIDRLLSPLPRSFAGLAMLGVASITTLAASALATRATRDLIWIVLRPAN